MKLSGICFKIAVWGWGVRRMEWNEWPEFILWAHEHSLFPYSLPSTFTSSNTSLKQFLKIIKEYLIKSGIYL